MIQVEKWRFFSSFLSFRTVFLVIDKRNEKKTKQNKQLFNLLRGFLLPHDSSFSLKQKERKKAEQAAEVEVEFFFLSFLPSHSLFSLSFLVSSSISFKL